MPDSLGNLYVGEDNAIWLRGLFDQLANSGQGGYVNDATITWVFRAASADGSFNASGSLVANAGGTMTYLADSNGDYYGTIEDDAAFTAGTKYWCVVTITVSGDVIGSRKIPYTPQLHGSTK